MFQPNTATLPDSFHFEPMLTIRDLTRMLRIDPRTVTRLYKRGRLPKPVKVGNANRWRAHEIEAFLRGVG
jgi:predicted DNA-binding transcriptional regulator AlpA